MDTKPKILKEVEDFRLLEFPCLLPHTTIKVFYEIAMSVHIWRNNQVQVRWIILRVILHEDQQYALKVATDIFNSLTRVY